MHRRCAKACDHKADGNDFRQQRQGLFLNLCGRLDDRYARADKCGNPQHRQRNDCGRYERIVQQSVKRSHYCTVRRSRYRTVTAMLLPAEPLSIVESRGATRSRLEATRRWRESRAND